MLFKINESLMDLEGCSHMTSSLIVGHMSHVNDLDQFMTFWSHFLFPQELSYFLRQLLVSSRHH